MAGTMGLPSSVEYKDGTRTRELFIIVPSRNPVPGTRHVDLQLAKNSLLYLGLLFYVLSICSIFVYIHTKFQ